MLSKYNTRNTEEKCHVIVILVCFGVDYHTITACALHARDKQRAQGLKMASQRKVITQLTRGDWGETHKRLTRRVNENERMSVGWRVVGLFLVAGRSHLFAMQIRIGGCMRGTNHTHCHILRCHLTPEQQWIIVFKCV